jgi:hypothetical protein
MSEIQRRSAIIVGVSAYQDGLTTLPNATNDAKRLAQVLKEQCQFDSDRVYLLIENSKGGELVPTKSNILSRIEYLISSSSENEIILFYFAGHGAEISGTSYLITEDTRMNVIDETAIDIKQLNSSLEKSKAMFTIRIFDACRNNFSAERAFFRGMTSDLQAALLKPVKGWATLSACSSNQFAHEDTDTEHGIFSRYLCEGLEGKAKDNNGNVTLEGLISYVKGAMDTWCNQRAKEQQPQFQLDISGQLIFTRIQSSQLINTESPSQQPYSIEPLGYLITGLDNHLNNISPDIRDIKITSSEICNQMAFVIHSKLKADLAKVHSGITPTLNNVTQTNIRKTPLWDEVLRLATSTKVAQELQEGRTLSVILNSSHTAIPTSHLYIAVIRFTFFYWIWWELICDANCLGRNYNPNPIKIFDYRTIAPSASQDEEKIISVINIILNQVSEQMLKWASQLGTFLDNVVDPIRQWKDIIK